jgi:hypothetical protein
MKSVRMRRTGNGAHMRKREVQQGFGRGTPEEKRQFGRLRRKWKNKIRMGL